MNHSRRRDSMASRTFPRRQCAFPRFLFLRPGLSYSSTPSPRGTFLKHINRFDNIEFGIGNKDGRSLIMATRKLVELSFLAMQDASIEYRGKKMGSFMCGTSTEHWTPVGTLCPRPSRHLDIPHLENNKRTHSCNTCKYVSQPRLVCPRSQWPFIVRGYGVQLLPNCAASRFECDKRRGVRSCFGWWLPAEYQVGLSYQQFGHILIVTFKSV